MKKLVSLLLVLVMALGLCSFAHAEEKIELEVLSGVTTPQAYLDIVNEVFAEFTADTGIEISFSAPGTGYEELMKTRMAANDLPDVFQTHGWAVVRYGEYLQPLNDQSYYDKIADGIRPIITDDEGNLLVLPTTYMVFGINYNADVLAEAGVDPASILTWDDFEAACEKIKAIGKAPIAVAGKDGWTAAQPFQDLCPAFLTAEDEAALADGTFDWEKVRPMAERYVKWVQNGYFNVDAVTADFNTICQQLASGDAAFVFCDTSPITQAKTYNPDANLHMIPIPAATADQSVFALGGEYLSWGVWKDSENKEAALKLIEYFSRPETVAKLSTATACVPGIVGAEFDVGELTADFEALSKLTIKGVWDRSLPSGMFNDLITSGQAILAGEEGAVDYAIETFTYSYEDKMMQ